MNYYGAKEMAASFRTVRKNTITIAEEIPEQDYGFSAAPETRTVANILSHLALGTTMALKIHGADRLFTFEGFDFPGFFGKLMVDEQAPRTKQQIITLLKEEGERFASWIDGLSDDFLAESVSFMAGMTPPSRTRFEMIIAVKEHEMHHRAQLMVIERMLGIVPHMTREMQAHIAAMMAAKAAAQ